MSTSHPILFVSNNASKTLKNVIPLSELNVNNELTVLNGIDEALDFIIAFGKENEKNCPELVFLDLANVSRDGITFLEAFSTLYIRNKEKVRIIFVTSATDKKVPQIFEFLGGFEFISKPLTEEKLFNCIARIPSY